MAIELNAKCKQILAVLKQNDGYVDNHDKQFHNLVQGPWLMFIVKFTRLRSEIQELCPIFICRVCNVNPFYYDNKDGQVHLSTYSIGGVVINGNIDEYNRDHLENEHWSKDRLDFIYYPFTGEKEEIV